MNGQTNMHPSLFRRLRWQAGVTQQEAAQLMGVCQQAVSAYERGACCRGPAIADWRIYRCADSLVEQAAA